MSKSTLEYKGYLGSVECDLDSDELFGKILLINDAIFYQGENLKELRQCFENALDDYIETCKEIEKNPDKPFSGTFNVRIAPELHREVAIKSQVSGHKSLNQSVVMALSKWVQRETVVHHKLTVIKASDVDFGVTEEEYSLTSSLQHQSTRGVH